MISEDRLARQTKAAKNGRIDGKDELPAIDALSLSNTENEIVGITQREADKLEDAFRQELVATGKEVLPSAAVAQQAFRGLVGDANNEISALVASRKDRLIHSRLDEIRANRELVFFKRNNDLNREAHYSGSGWWTGGIVFLCIGIETLLNAWFFGEASDRGLVGGAATAALISAANVALSFVTGWFPLRYSHHRRHWYKIWVLPMLCVAFFFIIMFNLAVGHYREMLIENPDAQLFRVIERLLTSPIDIQQIESWVLVIFGAVISGIALHKGFVWDDSYPGYARVHKHYLDARHSFQIAKEDLRLSIKEIADAKSSEIDSQVQGFRKAVNEYSAKVKALAQSASSLQTDVAALEEVCNRVLQIYRAENKAVRAPTPAPAYFSEGYELRKTIEWPEQVRVNDILTESESALSLLEGTALTAKDEITRRLESEIEQLDQMYKEIDVEANRTIKEEGKVLGSEKPQAT